MPKQKLIVIFSVFAAVLILASSYFMMERDKMKLCKVIEISLDITETETEGSTNIQEEIKEEIKHLNEFHLGIHNYVASIPQHFPYILEIPIIPHIEKPTPPPNIL